MAETPETLAHAAMEAVARHSYGKLVAFLAARTGDLAAAQDALGDAILKALTQWPLHGIPRHPEAWLMRVARHRLIDMARHQKTCQLWEGELRRLMEGVAEAGETGEFPVFPDERLKLLFVCAHPAVDEAARTPLMLQAVLGIDAARIASAYLVAPATMSQRLVRAKTRIRDAGIAFRIPAAEELEERLSFVLDAIYSAYTTGWQDPKGDSDAALAGEAAALARLLAQLMPNEPEVHGLLALLLHCEARKPARFTPEGAFIPLDEHDPTLWNAPLMEEAEEHLRQAAAFRRPGRYQLEAAIQSIHAARVVTGTIDWAQIALLYEGLVRIAPGSIGAQAGRAVALARHGEPGAALRLLEAIPPERVAAYQPYWAARAHILSLLCRHNEAGEAFRRAAMLTDDPALRAHLLLCQKKG